MTHNIREVEEDWKTELRKEYRKQTLAMAREVSASGTYEKVEGMICDWWFEKIDHQLQKARHGWLREEIVRLEGMKLGGHRDEDRRIYAGGNDDAIQTIIGRYQAELDQDNK